MSNLTDKEIISKIADFDAGIGWYQNITLKNGIQTKTRRIWGESLDHPKVRWNAVAKAIPESFEGMSVLDIGCNAGYFAIEAKKRGADYVCGVDLKPEYIEQAKFCNDVLGYDIDFRVLSVYELEKLGRQFDYVFCVGILYHCKFLMHAVEQISKVTKDTLLVETTIHPDDNKIPLVRFVMSSRYQGPDAEGDKMLPGHWHTNMRALKNIFLEQGFKTAEDVFTNGIRGGIIAKK